ncbi:peptidoglycan-binding protein [Streptomyces sp. XD-27]|uniref:peptidoglycan-binding domain-containing protein n=1 Tax=Streptomyces sp. XD-27 TaxID=3062779 RepID=UPI0026F419AF|nr:peptidoglycan-binding protein [Streptomyces sp. XD-27]WKX69131.1 peptidoglycan-binding protein [Streptomyces sp. XD-27]
MGSEIPGRAAGAGEPPGWGLAPSADSTVRPLLGSADAGPAAADVDLFAAAPDAPGLALHEPVELGPVEPGRAAHRRRAPRSRKTSAVVGAVVATAATAGLVSLAVSLFSGSDRADRAVPDGDSLTPRLILPTHLPSGDASRARPTAPPSGSPSVKSPSRRTTSSPTAAPEPGPFRSAPPSVGTARQPAAATGTPEDGPVLKPGSRGSEVVELQQRLAQVGLYDESADGRYDGGVRYAVLRYQQGYGVEGDGEGVYGPGTRRSLEARTTRP